MKLLQDLIDYLRSAKAEALKVSWPSRQDTVRYSSLVIGVSLALAVAFAAVDFGFTKLFNATLLSRVQQNQAPIDQPTVPTTEPTPATPQLDLDSIETTGGDVNVNVLK